MKPKRTILCVDDNEQSLSYRKIMLETRGYRVASYARGEEALERFKQGGIDLVVTDMAMPGMDGPQLIAAIKTLSPHVPTILISSKVRVYDHDSQADVFLARGMYAPSDLLERIRLLLVRKRGPKHTQQRSTVLPRQVGAA
jgi:two-component system, OmpR family, response regulator CpxR